MKKLSCLIWVLVLTATISNCQPRKGEYGGPFTPSGDFRFLIIFAGYERDTLKTSDHYFWDGWPQENISQNLPKCKTFLNNYETLFYNNFNQFNDTASDRSISNFYYQMSNNNPDHKPLRIIADFFPERINISGNQPDNYQVFKKIQQKYPAYDWSKYDLKKNNPSFQFNNDTTLPDGVLDYVVVIYRGPGLNGVASLYTNFTFKSTINEVEKEYQINSNCGFTVINSMFHLPGLKGLFIHELAHTLYNCPHYFYANGVLGDYFYSSAGWGMMAWNSINTSANAWESWYLGWINMENKTLSSIKDNGVYTLKDFVTTGDALRLKIPNTNQYLWLENHSGESIFDDRESWKTDGLGFPIPPPAKGLYAFVENITSNKSEIISPLSLKYSNGLKAITAQGNYDFIFDSETPDPRLWDNTVVNFIPYRPNPSSQHNTLATIRENYKLEKKFADKIVHRNFSNSGSDPTNNCGEHYPTKCFNEANIAYKVNGNYTFDCMGSSMAFNIPGQKFGIGNNPMILNHQRYDLCQQKLEPIVLHGLTVEIIEINDNAKDITIKVRFDDILLQNDIMLTGNLELKESPELENELVIGKNKTLTLAKSGSPNRHTKGETIGASFEYPDFITPTLLVVEPGAVLVLEKGSTIRIEDGSTLQLKKGAKLILGEKAKIVVSEGSYLQIDNPEDIISGKKSKIEYSKTGIKGLNPLLKSF